MAKRQKVKVTKERLEAFKVLVLDGLSNNISPSSTKISNWYPQHVLSLLRLELFLKYEIAKSAFESGVDVFFESGHDVLELIKILEDKNSKYRGISEAIKNFAINELKISAEIYEEGLATSFMADRYVYESLNINGTAEFLPLTNFGTLQINKIYLKLFNLIYGVNYIYPGL